MNNIQEIDTLSTSLESLSICNTRPLPLENDQVLGKTATLISRSFKATSKYNKAWNSKLDDGTMQSTGHERDLVFFEYLPKSSASSATNLQTRTKEVLCSKIYLTELEKQTMKAKMTELKN